MDQIQELLNILKETPQMAMWGLAIYFLFILLKMASWVGALTLLIKQFIKRYFDHKDESVRVSKANDVCKFFQKRAIGSVEHDSLIELLSSVRRDSDFIHSSDLREAISAIDAMKAKKKANL